MIRHLERSGIRRVVIVSPHLDDAVFSTSGLLLSAEAPNCEVMTVFTEGSAESDPAWAQAGGFADTVAEHEARREEDRVALKRLGADCVHLGFRPGGFTPDDAARVAERIAMPQETTDAGRGHLLCLLPAGAGLPAGRQRLLGLYQRLARCPRGVPAHPEHLEVRNRLLPHLRRRGLQVGFYSEFPYRWRDWRWSVRARLGALCGRPVRRYVERPDPDAKLAAAALYRSQLTLVFGVTREEQMRRIDRDEEYFALPSREHEE
ncbi:MAG TPA: PIG-L family deacetylase [Burkholderiaceae bacterium]|jgi:LmbE family N-acetylglucosaminyl deacetylase|nr:PIG-L family deacetylase [Burkholderiaceae bacterium]